MNRITTRPARSGSLVWRIINSDVVVVTALMTLQVAVAAAFFFLLSWLVYRDRYGVGLSAYVEMLF